MEIGDLMPIVTIGGFIVLGLALAYALIRNARRDRGKDAVTEAATRELYDKSVSGEAARDNAPGDRLEDVKSGERVPRYGESPRA
jgi:hypothetical protein